MTVNDNEYQKKDSTSKNIHPKNLKITNKILALLVAGTITLTGFGLSGCTDIKAEGQTYTPSETITEIDSKSVDPFFGVPDKVVINPYKCNYESFAIILNSATNESATITVNASDSISEYGAESYVTYSKEAVVKTVEEIKAQNPNKQIIVLNVDGEYNSNENSTIVILDHYDKEGVDALAMGYKAESPSSIIKYGKYDAFEGKRVPTSMESTLRDNGYKDVPSITIAYNKSSCNDSSITQNIVGAVARYGSLTKEQRNVDMIHQVVDGDCLSAMMEQTQMTESELRELNSKLKGNLNSNLSFDINETIFTSVPRGPLRSSSIVDLENKSQGQK